MFRIATARYTDSLHSDLTHLQSGNVTNTDTPTDNNSMGEASSPTDLLAASLDAYTMMIMGMGAVDSGADLVGVHAEVAKEMAANPCRMAKMTVDSHLSKDLDERSRRLLEAAARTRPVVQSLSTELVQELQFHYE